MNFEAVDWHTEVYLGGRHIGNHSGGYDGFSFDITDHAPAGEEVELLVGVWDPTEGVSYPLKCCNMPKKMFGMLQPSEGKVCNSTIFYYYLYLVELLYTSGGTGGTIRSRIPRLYTPICNLFKVRMLHAVVQV